jgi:hypothetical protein
MISWQREAIDLFYAARERATETSNTFLHQACGRAIEVMFAEGGSVPSELRAYAQATRRLYGPCALFQTTSMSSGYVG